MHSVTNTTKGPRFVYAQGEPRLIEAGETVPLDLSDSEIKNVQHQVDAGLLAWDGEPPKAKAEGASDGPDMTAAELIAAAGSMNFMKWKAAAAKVLMDGSPATKDDILAALQHQVDAEKAKADAGGAQA